MRADEGVNDEDLEEADLLVERLPPATSQAAEVAHHRTEPLSHIIEAERDLTVGRQKTTATRVSTGQRAGHRQPQDRPAPGAAVRRMLPSVTASVPRPATAGVIVF